MPTAYERHKLAALKRQAEISREGRDIGDIPPVADSRRKGRAIKSFRAFAEAYFPLKFSKPWSPDHLKVIAAIEKAVKDGGLFSLAMPRGNGKTTICECATMWALLSGWHKFVYLIGASEDAAGRMLENIKAELSNNANLLADFPEICYPIKCLENQARRAIGQLHHGQPTRVSWGAGEIVLPDIPGSRAAGSLVKVTGITGNIRGANHTLPTGESIRPSLAIIDDPQTDQSARSPSQCANRLATVTGAILNLPGPGKRIAALMPCTVIQQGDLADQILDRDKNPEWQGQRTKLVYQWPTAEKLWAEYGRIRQDDLKNGGDGSKATDYYRAHRRAMDAGAIVAWDERFDPEAGELSAIQHAYNLRLRIGEAAFNAEMQNEPAGQGADASPIMDAEDIAAKVNGYARGELPQAAAHVTAFIDVQQTVLFWMVCAWADDFTGWIVDYGTYPEQPGRYFTLGTVKRTIQGAHPGKGLEATIYAALETCTNDLLARDFLRDDGATLRIGRLLIDANWGDSTDTVYSFAKATPHTAIVMPSHGRYVGATSNPFSEYKRKVGDRIGHYWRMPSVQGKRAVRYTAFDANHWKSFVHARLNVAMADPGCLSLFTPGRAESHLMLSEHLTAERPTQVTARERTVSEWKLRSPGLDNHWLDGLVGCAVAASIEGAHLFGEQKPTQRRRVVLKAAR